MEGGGESQLSQLAYWFQSLSGFLARCDAVTPTTGGNYDWFQSLSGFLARCDEKVEQLIRYITSVSIPIGFSGSLRLMFAFTIVVAPAGFQSLSGFLARCDSSACPQESNDGVSVSIPIGFSGSLRRLDAWPI